MRDKMKRIIGWFLFAIGVILAVSWVFTKITGSTISFGFTDIVEAAITLLLIVGGWALSHPKRAK